MSSHSIQLAKALRVLELVKASLKEAVNDGEYSRGMYNGLELATSLLNTKKIELAARKGTKEREG